MVVIDENVLSEEVTKMVNLINSKSTNSCPQSDHLMQELKKYIYRYHMDVESSERAILLDYGISEADIMSVSSEFKNISDINVNDKSISVIAKITSINHNQLKDGRSLWKVDIDDGSSTIILTIWDENVVSKIEIGKIYRIVDCYPGEYRGIIGITLGRKGTIIEDHDSKIVHNYEHLHRKLTRLSELNSGMTGITVGGIIRASWNKQVNGYNGPTIISEGIIDDEGIAVSFTDWANREFKNGDYVFMVGVQVKEYHGVLSISLNKNARVIVKVE